MDWYLLYQLLPLVVCVSLLVSLSKAFHKVSQNLDCQVFLTGLYRIFLSTSVEWRRSCSIITSKQIYQLVFKNLLYAKQCSKCFACINSFNVLNNPMRQILLLFLFLEMRNSSVTCPRSCCLSVFLIPHWALPVEQCQGHYTRSIPPQVWRRKTIG